MGGFSPFKAPSAPAPVIVQPEPIAPIEAITPENTADEIGQDEEALKKKLKEQRGRAATMLSGDDVSTGGTATKKLLGG